MFWKNISMYHKGTKALTIYLVSTIMASRRSFQIWKLFVKLSWNAFARQSEQSGLKNIAPPPPPNTMVGRPVGWGGSGGDWRGGRGGDKREGKMTISTAQNFHQLRHCVSSCLHEIRYAFIYKDERCGNKCSVYTGSGKWNRIRARYALMRCLFHSKYLNVTFNSVLFRPPPPPPPPPLVTLRSKCRYPTLSCYATLGNSIPHETNKNTIYSRVSLHEQWALYLLHQYWLPPILSK